VRAAWPPAIYTKDVFGDYVVRVGVTGEVTGVVTGEVTSEIVSGYVCGYV